MWRDFARIAGIELLHIDADTTIDNFERDLRANAAFYRLAQGL
jgi:L-arabinose isomerase